MFLLLCRPQKKNLANFKEIFNEFVILLMSYFILSFTGAEPDSEKRAWLGWCLIFISLSNIAFHMIGLIIDSIRKTIKILRKVVKKLCTKRKKQKL